MFALPAISSIAQTIQLAIAPVFLLAGIGAILNVMAGRLARVVDRARVLEELHPTSTGPEHARHVWELRLLDRRMSIINNAILLCVSSAIAVCILVALLFITQMVDLPYRQAVAIAFVLAMLLLVAGLVLFLIEIRIAIRGIQVREELLERQRR
jgi:sterol desaturase/sphingolipid hydroxylase (fatty acid hydroxylase superfamily)